eukprot:scaffold12014_cov114-Isochrysis_galbana.AAC.1
MGDPSRYPEIRLARHMYALQWLPRAIRDDRPLLQSTVDRQQHVLSRRARSRSFKLEMLTFVGLHGLFIKTSICAALACAPNGFGPGERGSNIQKLEIAEEDETPVERLCRRANERTFHFGTCPVIIEIFSNLLRIDLVNIHDPTNRYSLRLSYLAPEWAHVHLQ